MTGTRSSIAQQDRRVLRELGKRIAEIAADPLQQESRKLWTRLNRLDSVRPMVWIFEVPWHEMEVDGELTTECSDPLCRQLETSFRRQIYQWDRMPGDMLVAPYLSVPPALGDTGFGIREDVDVERTDAASGVVSRHYHIQIRDEADIEKIQMPVVTLNEEVWQKRYEFLAGLFDGVLPVKKGGMRKMSIAPWDWIVRLTGVEEILLDMCIRPAYVHKLVDRFFRAFIRRLEQYDALNVLAPNNDDDFSGGGYECTDELPGPDCDPTHIRPRDMWGRTMSQIFSAVSPAMHEEFALQYECRWLNRFGLTYYGCCEPLDKKVDILRRNVPNLRKISMSPWIDLDVAAENVGTDYVFSLKPNPAVFTESNWDPPVVRRELARTLVRLKGMHVEIAMKDISTVEYHPERLWEWARIAVEIAKASV